MTEVKWTTSEDVLQLLQWDHVQTHARRLRLFGCGCCRQLDRWLTHPRVRKALEACERYANGVIQAATLSRWDSEASNARAGVKHPPGQDAYTPEWITYHAVAYACSGDRYTGWRLVAKEILRSEDTFGPEFIAAMRTRFAELLRDIFGNPFRPVAFSPAWRTDDVVSLAKQVYESRDFGAMPILADAIQDAGCDNDAILNHCRNDKQVHARGCWIVDLVLGKA